MSLEILDQFGKSHNPTSMIFVASIDVLGPKNFFSSYPETVLLYLTSSLTHKPLHPCKSIYAPKSQREEGKGLVSKEKGIEVA